MGPALSFKNRKDTVMRRFKGKDNMNTLLNIDTVFGEYEGRVLPIIITIGLIALPPLVWLFFLQGTFIRLWWILVFDVFWGARWGLIILGKEKEKKEFFLQQRIDASKSADELIHIQYIHEDGLIEYDNGKVAVIISGYLKGYLTDDKLSVDMEHFMDELDTWDWDMYLHNSVDEILCEDSLPNLKRYKDNDIIRERIEFYNYQDEWSRTHSALYRISFLVSSYKFNFKKLKSHMEELISSEVASVFNEIELLKYDDVIDVLNRDICGYVNITDMLTKKFNNDNYYGSKVLWYDDEVPQELVPERDTSDMDSRRTSK